MVAWCGIDAEVAADIAVADGFRSAIRVSSAREAHALGARSPPTRQGAVDLQAHGGDADRERRVTPRPPYSATGRCRRGYMRCRIANSPGTAQCLAWPRRRGYWAPSAAMPPSVRLDLRIGSS